MNSPTHDVGAFIQGSPNSPRQLARWCGLLEAYADCEIETGHEAYLSHFVFGPEMTAHYKANGQSVAGFNGPTWARWLVFDIDRPNLDDALADARKLTAELLRRYPMLDGSIPIFFSGGKGLHVYLELVHEPPPAVGFNAVCRTLAEGLAAAAGVRIDSAIYDANRILRLPNSRHPRTGLFKVRIETDELFRLDMPAILELAKQPTGRGIPTLGDRFPEIADDWQAAEQESLRKAGARTAIRRDCADGEAGAPRYLIDFFRFGIEEGARNKTLFQCAAWLAEQDAPDQLVNKLLDKPARDTGLPSSEVKRTIASGIAHARRQSEGGLA